MKMISIERHGKVSVLKLNRGATNALNLQLITCLAENLSNVREDPKVRGLVMCGSNDKFFSIGFDIPELIQLKKKDFKVFYQAFNQVCLDLYTFPKPTVAAITGHAVAGGCILTLCCDYRLIAEGRRLMGLNEIKLGVPVPYPGDRILQQIVGTRNAREIMSTGEFYLPEESMQKGIVDQMLKLDEVLAKSIEKAQMLGERSPKAFTAIKHNRVETVEAQIRTNLREKEHSFVECWYSSDAHERLKKAIEKF